MPRHLHYVEAYGGGLSVLLDRDPNDSSLWLTSKQGGVSEVVNDIDGELQNFWRVLREPSLFPQLQRMAAMTPLGREAFDEAKAIVNGQGRAIGDEVLRAWAFFVYCRQSRAGTFKGFTNLTRSRLRRGINGNASEWLGAIDGLTEVHLRLQPVVVECMPALDLIEQEDGKDTLFYLDPTYLPATRKAKKVYRFEMTTGDHVRLLEKVVTCKGKFMISAYQSNLYDHKLKGWTRHEHVTPNHAAGGKTKRLMTECLYCNF